MKKGESSGTNELFNTVFSRGSAAGLSAVIRDVRTWFRQSLFTAKNPEINQRRFR